MQPKPPWPYVRFKWLDAYSEDAWVAVASYPVHDHMCEASGYLLKETPTYLLVSPSVAWNEHSKEWEACTSLAVPKGMVLGPVRILKRVPKKKGAPGGAPSTGSLPPP